MRNPGWTPSIVPNDDDQTAYIVVEDFGPIGRSYRETDIERADLEAVIMGMLEGEFSNPVRVVAFNTAEALVAGRFGGDVAHEVRYRCDLQMRDVPFYLEYYVEQYEGRYHDVQLPLPMLPLYAMAFQPKLLAEIEYRTRSAEGKVGSPFL